MTQSFLRPAAVLTAICLVVSAALTVTHRLTAPVIEEAERAKAEAALKAVLPEADRFEAIAPEELPGGVIEAHRAQNGAGLAVVAEGPGYGGAMRAIVGIDADGRIAGVQVLSHSETEGLGSRVAEEGFLGRLTGKGAALEGVSAIAGATVSSNALFALVQSAFDAYAAAEGQAREDPVGLTEAKLARYYPGVTDFNEQTVGGVRAIRCGGDGWAVFGAAQGYRGALVAAVLFDATDNILGVVVERHSETPGLGSLVAEPEFTAQFAGRREFDDIDQVAGATVSTKAIKEAVRAAVAALPAVKEAMA